MEEKYIQFVANYDEWQSVKKLKIEGKMDPKTVMEFLASLTTSVDKKVEENLKKIVALEKLETALNEEVLGGKSEQEIANAIMTTSSGKINKVINEICAIESFQKNEQKELVGFCKTFAMRSSLKKMGLAIDYSQIEIPGMKRVMKKKV